MKRLCVGKGSSSKQKQINAWLGTVPQALQGNAGKGRGSNSQLESPLPQPINDVLCFSKINLIQCTSDFVFHVLEKKVRNRIFSHVSCFQEWCTYTLLCIVCVHLATARFKPVYSYYSNSHRRQCDPISLLLSKK